MSASKAAYVSKFVAVATDDLEEAAGSTPNNGLRTIDEFLEETSIPIDAELPSLRSDARGTVGARLGFLEVTEAGTAVTELREQGIRATVVNVVALANHWGYAPGTKPVVVDDELIGPRATDADRVIGVVDSGIAAGCPPWLSDYVDLDDPFDREDPTAEGLSASHGTFVAGLLRQLACDHRVSMVRLPLVDHSQVKGPDGSDLSGVQLSTEVHLYEAIVTLCHRHPKSLDALNLSLGTYTVDDFSSAIMRAAINYWYCHTDGKPVFAAGGNEYESTDEPYSPFWPAAFADVIAVGASDPNGTEVVWDYHDEGPPDHFAIRTAPTAGHRRPWIDRTAPGTDIVGLSGTTPPLVKWSGSSFATPISLAMQLTENVRTSVVHSSVSGLAYESNGSVSVVAPTASPCASPVQAQ
ncbi:MAG TPA: S8/S53 family peptidase [Acidimicrobiia bacterium]|nr:S8/S53 family peptidase [Acidimicrobiia bacterium]